MQVCTKTKPAMSSACDRILRWCVLVPWDLLTLAWQYDKIVLIFILSANWFLIYKFHDIVLSYQKTLRKILVSFLSYVNQRNSPPPPKKNQGMRKYTRKQYLMIKKNPSNATSQSAYNLVWIKKTKIHFFHFFIYDLN